MNQYILLAIYWIGYFAIHSLLATAFAKRQLSFIEPYYRLFYNVVSLVGLLFLLFYTAIITPEWLFARNGISKFFGLMLATYGILVLKASFRVYSLKDFMGTAQLKEDYKEESFVKGGILEYVRHPLYLGTLLIVVGFFIFSPSVGNLIVMLITIAYLTIGIQLEERKLIKFYGESYKTYKENVPMIFPNSFRIFH